MKDVNIKIGSKWECIIDNITLPFRIGDIIIVDDVNLVRSLNGDSSIKHIVHSKDITDYFKPFEFKLQEWDIVQCRDGHITLAVNKSNNLQFGHIIISGFDENLMDSDFMHLDIMKVWRLHDISIKQTLEEQIKNVEPIWVREEEPKTIYDIEFGDYYWFKDHFNDAIKKRWINNDVDICRLETGNIFLTKEDCEFSIEEDKVRAIMRKYACTDKEWLSDDDAIKYMIGNWASGIKVSWYSAIVSSEFSYKTEKIAQQVIDEIGEERLLKYYFKVI